LLNITLERQLQLHALERREQRLGRLEVRAVPRDFVLQLVDAIRQLNLPVTGLYEANGKKASDLILKLFDLH